MLTIQAILTAAASGPDAVKALCEPLTDDALRAEIKTLAPQAQLVMYVGARKARVALESELSRRTLVDPGWECDRCGHVNDDVAEYCAGEKCVSFREWAAQQPQEDQ